MVRMAHPTDIALSECHDFATHQSFPEKPAARCLFETLEPEYAKTLVDAVWVAQYRCQGCRNITGVLSSRAIFSRLQKTVWRTAFNNTDKQPDARVPVK
jgi:hypothetical protein